MNKQPYLKQNKVIYYNNFLNEKLGALDITYPYTTSSITRTMDASDVITKLYVKPVTSEANSNEYITIINTPANKSGEDYLLNFEILLLHIHTRHFLRLLL